MKMISIRETAEQMGVSAKTVYRLIHKGAFAPVKIGSATRIDQTELEEYIQSQPRGLK
jgi:excisionase family DNA binding protein